MEKTYGEQLSEKKIKLEEALKMEMDLLEVTKNNIKHMTEEEEIPGIVECFEKDKEHRELVIEALQDEIDEIDRELRKEVIVMSPKDELSFYKE